MPNYELALQFLYFSPLLLKKAKSTQILLTEIDSIERHLKILH